MSKPVQLNSDQPPELVLPPVEPSQYWTFDNALALLQTCHDPYILQILDEFLLLNSKVLLNPAPFTTSGGGAAAISGKEISIRAIVYEISPVNITDAETIVGYLPLFDTREILRVISQTCHKIPAKFCHEWTVKSKLHEDRDKILDNERLYLYTSKFLRQRRSILKIVVELVNHSEYSQSNIVKNLGKEIILSPDYLDNLIGSLQETCAFIIDGKYDFNWKKLNELVYNESVLFAIQLCQVLVEVLVKQPIDKKLVKHWFQFMKRVNFGMSLNCHYPDSFNHIQGLFTVISVLVLDLDHTYENNYASEVELFKFINDIITHSNNTNSVVLYSWSIIVLRKYYYIQEYPSSEYSLSELNSTINLLNQRSTGVFGQLRKYNEVLQFDKIYSGILSTVITAALPLVSLTDEVVDTIYEVIKNCPQHIIESFFTNESTKNTIILARTKFPLLLTGYIKLCSIHGNFALNEFNELLSYIQAFNKDEFVQMYQIDDENTELVKLTQVINVYPPFETNTNKKLSMMLPLGTKAKILPGSSDKVLVSFLYKYNGWAFLGRILQNISKFNNNDTKLVIDILNLINQVVLDNDIEQSKLVLESMSTYTDDSDIFEVILRLLDQGLHSRNVDILVAVVQLLTNCMPFLSYRIWPYLSKSVLFTDKQGYASIIFGTIEMINGNYEFTIALIKLCESLVNNCISINQDYPENSKSLILTKIISYFINLFESFIYCRFNKSCQKMEMGVLILDVFSTILTTVYGVEDATKVLTTSAELILDSFLVIDKDNSRAAAPILSMIESLSSLEMYELNDGSGFWYDSWIRCCLSYSTLLINIRSTTALAPSAFERNLFMHLPSLVSSYSRFEFISKDILDLLTSLTNAKWQSATPSLLSHLGNDFSQMLLHSLATDLDNSFSDYKLKISLYDFICSVMMGGNQEGLSVLFISGRDVFGDYTKDKHDQEEHSGLSLLTILKKNVGQMKYYPNSVSIHLVDSLALAFNLWTTSTENDQDIDFIKTLISRVKLNMTDIPDNTESYISRCYELKLTAKIVEILSLYLFTSKNNSVKQLIVDFIKEDYLDIAKNKFTIVDYKPNLHSNLTILFESTVSYKLNQFCTKLTKRNRFGISNIYNLPIMDSLFKHEPQYDQIREQLIASSINLQYLNAQVSSAKSFGALITCFYTRGYDLHDLILQFIDYLLEQNINEGVIPDLSSIYYERIELGFYLMYSYYTRSSSNTNTSVKQVFEIIKTSSTLLCSSSMNYLANLAESQGYYRPLLKIIYCGLLLLSRDDDSILIEYFSLFRDLFELIITKSIKTLLIEVQNDVYLSRTNKNHKSTKLNDKIDDLMMILSILKLFIKLSNQRLHQEMSRLIVENDMIKSLLNLYSISHIIEVNDDFIFAQLSLMYILELMSIEIIANQFIQSGLFVVLLESPISIPIRNGGLSISHGAQYYRLWINGILPLIITSLSKLGPELGEIRMVLQLYNKQLEYCIESWSRDSSSIKISTSIIAETNQILIIDELLTTHILPGLENEQQRDEFEECIENLLKHPKFLTSRIVPSSLDEQRLIEIGGEAYESFIKGIIDEIRDLKDYLVA
ncbi:Nucleoporin [Spathaspora sp. JA1]|nr:Nucleoporin [Spathaspora sp. JA1]